MQSLLIKRYKNPSEFKWYQSKSSFSNAFFEHIRRIFWGFTAFLA